MRSKFAVFGPKCEGRGVVLCLDSVQYGCRFGRHGVSGWLTERIHLALLEDQLVPLLRLLRQRLTDVLAILLLTGLVRFTSELTLLLVSLIRCLLLFLRALCLLGTFPGQQKTACWEEPAQAVLGSALVGADAGSSAWFAPCRSEAFAGIYLWTTAMMAICTALSLCRLALHRAQFCFQQPPRRVACARAVCTVSWSSAH